MSVQKHRTKLRWVYGYADNMQRGLMEVMMRKSLKAKVAGYVADVIANNGELQYNCNLQA